MMSVTVFAYFTMRSLRIQETVVKQERWRLARDVSMVVVCGWGVRPAAGGALKGARKS
jgi:hypothetical protein